VIFFYFFIFSTALQISIMVIIKGLDGKDKGEMRQDSSRKKILPFEFVVLEACLEAVISSLQNEVCALYIFPQSLLFIWRICRNMHSYSLVIFKTQCYFFNMHLVIH